MISEVQAKEKVRDKKWRMNHLYKIKTKERKLQVFKPNLAQQDLMENRTSRDFLLKARQLGMSTYGLIDLLDDTIWTPNTNSGIVAHKQDKVTKLFEIVTRAYHNMPEMLKPRASYENRNELYFPDLDSKIFVTMDLRSEMVHNLHISELAFLQKADEKMTGILEAVPKGGKITIETTANGMSGRAYEEWDDEKSEFTKHFYNWMWEVDYRTNTTRTMEDLTQEYASLAVQYRLIPDLIERFKLDKEQLAWYISKIHRHKDFVVQEYPSTDLEAFVASGRNVFNKSDLDKHVPIDPIDRKYGDLLIWEQPLKGFQYVMGIDTSEGVGGDNAVIEVYNAHTGNQAAEFAASNVPPSMLGTIAINIGNLFNKAFMVPEINSSGISFVDHVKAKYYNIYYREVFDKTTKEYTKAIGWRTTGTTKPMLVNTLEEAIRDEGISINSKAMLKECKTFVRSEEAGKQGYAAEGSHKDDRVIATGLAVQGIRYIPAFKAPVSQAEQKVKDYVSKNKLVSSGMDEEEASKIINRRNRPRYSIRRK